MPFCIPHRTTGGPANPQHSLVYWLALDESEFFQVQQHKCEHLLWRAVAFVGLRFKEPRLAAKIKRRENGDINVDTFRIIIKLEPDWICIATAGDRGQIMDDWQSVVEQLEPRLSAELRAGFKNSTRAIAIIGDTVVHRALGHVRQNVGTPEFFRQANEILYMNTSALEGQCQLFKDEAIADEKKKLDFDAFSGPNILRSIVEYRLLLDTRQYEEARRRSATSPSQAEHDTPADQKEVGTPSTPARAAASSIPPAPPVSAGIP